MFSACMSGNRKEFGQLLFVLGLIYIQKLNPLSRLILLKVGEDHFLLQSCCKTESLKYNKTEEKANCSTEQVHSGKNVSE